MHWSHDYEYPHRVNANVAATDVQTIVKWCNSQWGHSDKMLVHKPGVMTLRRTNRRSGWYFFGGTFNFKRADHAMIFKLAYG